MIYEVANAIAAYELALELKQEGKYDWFRGQTKNWTLNSSFNRLSKSEREQALEQMARFEQWTKQTKGLEELVENPDQAIAVGQHYGLKTTFIDFTTDPSVATFFATENWNESDSENGVVICLNTENFLNFWELMPSKYPSPECLSLTVKNLWRLEAQHGVFLFCPYKNLEHAFYDMDRIIFPHSDQTPDVSHERIYPARESELEIVLRQYLMNEHAIRSRRVFADEIARMHNIYLEQPGEFGNPKFLNDSTPTLIDSWNDSDLKSWVITNDESFFEIDSKTLIPVTIGEKIDPKQSRRDIAISLEKAFQEQRNIRNESIKFVQSSSEGRELKFLNRLWDGLRRLPYNNEEIIRGISNAVCLFGYRLQTSPNPMTPWTLEAEKSFGPALEVEFGTIDGSYSRAFVNRERLFQAVRDDYLDYIDEKYKEQNTGNMKGLLQAIYTPNRLFEFRKLATLFATEIAPVQVLTRGSNQAVFYSPARLTVLGLP